MSAKITASADGTYGSLGVGANEAFRFGSDNSGQLAGFRNRIINGGCSIFQRGNNPTPVIGGPTYFADRWMIYAGGAAATSNGKGAGYVGYFASSISATGSAGNTAINFIQRIESANCSDMAAGKTYTFSGYVRATDTRTVTYQISSANTADTFTSTTVVSSGTLATTSGSNFIKFSVSFTATDACANGVEVAIVYGAVGAGVVVNASNIQLEAGSIATPFEQRPIGLELSLCQRYFEAGNFWATGYANGAGPSQVLESIKLKCQKRAVPTYSFGSSLNYVNASAAAFWPASQKDDNVLLVVTAAAPGLITCDGIYAASAEL